MEQFVVHTKTLLKQSLENQPTEKIVNINGKRKEKRLNLNSLMKNMIVNPKK